MLKNLFLFIIAWVIRFFAEKVVGPVCDFLWRNDDAKEYLLRVASSVENKMDENIEYVSHDIKAAFKNRNNRYNNFARHNNLSCYDDSIFGKMKKWLDNLKQTVFYYAVIFVVVLITIIVAVILFAVIGII